MSCNEDMFLVGTIRAIAISVTHTTKKYVLEIRDNNATRARDSFLSINLTVSYMKITVLNYSVF